MNGTTMHDVDVLQACDRIERNCDEGTDPYKGLTDKEIFYARRWHRIKRKLGIDDSVRTMRKRLLDPRYRDLD